MTFTSSVLMAFERGSAVLWKKGWMAFIKSSTFGCQFTCKQVVSEVDQQRETE